MLRKNDTDGHFLGVTSAHRACHFPPFLVCPHLPRIQAGVAASATIGATFRGRRFYLSLMLPAEIGNATRGCGGGVGAGSAMLQVLGSDAANGGRDCYQWCSVFLLAWVSVVIGRG
jgi:hypothetical protein